MPALIRIDGTTLPALIFGGLLLVVAIGLGVYVWIARRALDPIVTNDEPAQLHANRQFRRRLQVSLLLATIGILIPLGDQLGKVFIERPLTFLLWVIALFLLVIWMVLLALGDWLSTLTYSEIAKARLRFERRELEEDIRRYHASKTGENGADSGQNNGRH